MKAIGIKMVDLQPMDAYTALDKGYRIGNGYDRDCENMRGYEVTYPDGYKSWCPKDVADKAYFKLNESNDGTKICKEDVEAFIKFDDACKVGTKTTNVTITTITGYEINGQASCVDPNQFNIDLGIKIAKPRAMDQLWGHLGFVLQWAKNGINPNY